VKKTIAPPPPAPKAPAITPPGLVFQPNPITIIVPTSTPDVTSPIIVSNLSYNSSPILTYTNKERTNQGLKPLADNATLDQVAKLRLDDLFANQYFDHASPDGKSVVDLVKLENYNYLLIGENIALGNFGLPGQGDDQGIVSAWMASPDHRENILNAKYQELGIAERADNYKGQTETIAVQVFGEPSATCSKPSPNTQDLINTNTNSLVQAQAQAKVMYDNLNTIKNDPHLDKAYYNQKTQEYNYYAKQINDAVLVLKNMVDLYNSQVSKYNACIGA
jgi:uncharacterized protein YkwD